MPRKLRQLRAEPRREGFHVGRQVGSHEIWTHPLIPGVGANLVGKDGADAKPYQEKEVREAIQKVREARQRQKGQGQP